MGKKEKKRCKKIRYITDYLLRLIAFLIITAILWKNLCLNNFLISSEVLVLICFLLIASIGTAYDKISVAKLIELKKDIKIKNEESNEYKNRYDTIAKEFATVLRITQQQTINNNNKIVNTSSSDLELSSKNEKKTNEISKYSLKFKLISIGYLSIEGIKPIFIGFIITRLKYLNTSLLKPNPLNAIPVINPFLFG